MAMADSGRPYLALAEHWRSISPMFAVFSATIWLTIEVYMPLTLSVLVLLLLLPFHGNYNRPAYINCTHIWCISKRVHCWWHGFSTCVRCVATTASRPAILHRSRATQRPAVSIVNSFMWCNDKETSVPHARTTSRPANFERSIVSSAEWSTRIEDESNYRDSLSKL